MRDFARLDVTFFARALGKVVLAQIIILDGERVLAEYLKRQNEALGRKLND